MLKIVITILLVFNFCSPIIAERKSHGTKLKGYGYTNTESIPVKGSFNKKTGNYTKHHRRTSPNSTQKDNYSTQGNQNPWTGKNGSKSAEK